MAWFSAFRTPPFPTLYGENKTPVTVDLVIAGLIFSFLIVLFSALIVTPGVRKFEQFVWISRVFIGLLLFSGIVFSLFGDQWEVGNIEEVLTTYKAGFGKEVKVSIGLKIDLRGFNITMKGQPVSQYGEKIDYNERFTWNNPWTQGRLGFGEYAFTVSQQFRAAQQKGVPLPILWVAEYFTFDGEGLRWGRFYKQAGYYTHISVWLGFALYIVTAILSTIIVLHTAVSLLLTGLALLGGNLIYLLVRNDVKLQIPFGADAIIKLRYGWSFYMCLATGVTCVLLALLLLLIDRLFQQTIYKFFQLDSAIGNVQEVDGVQSTEADETNEQIYIKYRRRSIMSLPHSKTVRKGTANGHQAATQSTATLHSMLPLAGPSQLQSGYLNEEDSPPPPPRPDFNRPPPPLLSHFDNQLLDRPPPPRPPHPSDEGAPLPPPRPPAYPLSDF